MVGGKALRRHFVAVLGTTHAGHGHAVADLDALDGVDAHQRVRDVRIQAVEYRFTQTRRQAPGLNLDAGTDGIAFAAHAIDQRFELCDARGIGHEERIAVDRCPIHSV